MARPPIKITHAGIWSALDQVAAEKGITVSRMAISAGLDRTTFARSKRNGNGRLHWPSTESIAAVCMSQGIGFPRFARMAVAASAKGA